jgi:hypothetical protein
MTPRSLVTPLLGLSLCTWFVAGPVLAATLERTDTVERSGTLRDSIEDRYAISHEDCLEDVTYTFSLVASDTSNSQTFEVWVGAGNTDCSDKGSRTTTPLCWPVYSEVAGKTNLSVTLRSQQMLGIAPESQVTGAVDSCDPEDTTVTAAQTMSVYFLIVGDGDESKAEATYSLKYDLLGPPPPTGLETGVAERQIPLSWDRDEEGTTEITGYRFYCAPNEAEVSDDEPDACSSRLLVAGEIPDPELACGSVDGSTATGGIARGGLDNGRSYVVAVASEDALGNLGVLSEPTCATPAEVDDFYELYENAGGEGGGGLCAIGHGRERSLATLLASGLLLAGSGLRRRTRARARRLP